MTDRQAPSSRRIWPGSLLVLAASLAATVPTTGDLGLTWDEPAYRYSQLVSAQWWEQLASARSRTDLDEALDPDALLYFWPYGRHGINFHPPLSGQLDLLTYAVFGGWMKDIPARRLASVFEYVITITVLYHFLTRRYGVPVGLTAAGALLTMPRVYGHGHLAGTDTPGMMLWLLAAVSCWKGLTEPGSGRWRAAVGLLIGLSFLVKMAAVMVLLPILAWLALGPLPRELRRGGRGAWLDATLTTGALLLPLAVAFLEIRRLSGLLPPPAETDLFVCRPEARLPGAILLAPLAVWLARRALARVFPRSTTWGVERPALEILGAILAFAPAVGWLGNPAWWREALPRLAHYAMLNVDREGALPDIRIYYLGETYLFSLPWHNGWVLIAVTVPATILLAAAIGLGFGLRVVRRDRLPLYLLVHFLTLPALRMLPTPAHDGIRLMLPCFPFLAAFAGWGTAWAAGGLARLPLLRQRPGAVRAVATAAVVGWSAAQLALIHPFELSYYNRLVGGPRGAWRLGFELSYWYDAFTPETIRAINAILPEGASVVPANEYSQVPTFAELQSLGALRGDLRLDERPDEGFPYVWLLTHDSKANAYSRLLFAMEPAFERRPRQLGGLRVAAVSDPDDAALAWAVQLLAAGSGTPDRVEAPLPGWLRSAAPWLARFWGEGLSRPTPPGVFEPAFSWAADDPQRLRAAAVALAEGRPDDSPDSPALRAILDRFGPAFTADLLARRPGALVDAVELLIDRPDALRLVLRSPGYTDPAAIGGPLDRPTARRDGEAN
ncbi:glycosyltransferase family 39 protein [Tautonia sociabilis]|uniref:Glycosyltransferase family 39 protein n=1 Tax=Tautonia sociabilis TaxID=2080755 RepID=A0A432MP21_9BACT|nr:glycosyltransferase family 39 protein [Tautonia sociabilis]RUL89191.1 glycosyltransferase family 39 protein [Tautonia sociabilis]